MSLPEVDTLIFFFINRDLQNRLFDILMPFITSKAYLLFLPFIVFFFLKDRKWAIIVLTIGLASLALSDWGSHMLKHVFERPRPCNTLEDVHLLVGCSSSFSMPSNHAVNAFAFALPFYLLFKNKLRYTFVIIAFTVAFSRAYIGVHYPSDVLVGALFGIIIAFSVVNLYNYSYTRYKEKPHTTILFIFLLAMSLFRIYYITQGPLDLSPDEAHYWEWSRRLDWSYYSKGPMIAYLIYMSTSIFGDSVFGIRIMAVLFSALSSIFLYILGKKLYDEKVGLFSAILIQIIPLFSAFGILFTIDSPFIFFWILSLFFFWKVVSSGHIIKDFNSELGTRNSNHLLSEINPPTPPLEKGGKGGFEKRECRGTHYSSPITHHPSLIYWILLGISIGCGLLTKYTMALFYLSAFLFLLLLKEQRKVLFTKGPYVAFLISLIVFSPVIIWNTHHDWVTFRHTAGQVQMAKGVQLSLKSFFEFFGSQLGIITPFLFIIMGVSLWKLRNQPEGAFLFWFSIPIIAFFLLKSIQGKVQANWALPGYITGIIAFSVYSIKRFYSEGKSMKIFIVTAVLLSVIATSVGHYSSLLSLPGKMDPTNRIRGWKELGTEVTKIYEGMSAIRPTFIFSDGYQMSSELAFYVKGHPVTYCINLGRRMNQYDLWPGFNNLLHYDAIFVRIGDAVLPDQIAHAFEKVEKRVFTVYTKEKSRKIRDYSLFLCYDFKGIKEEKPGSY
jgi:4-amino-4-deoxy-L-arabinose transferase-like glycosyltransferase/membrane-associated phospholipid phosphatase